jgi:uncharacterized protein YciI
MFAVELSFDPDPRRLGARPAHRSRLRGLRERGLLVMAGPFADDTGALLIFDVESEEELADLMGADPYYATPGVTVRSTRRWAPLDLGG